MMSSNTLLGDCSHCSKTLLLSMPLTPPTFSSAAADCVSMLALLLGIFDGLSSPVTAVGWGESVLQLHLLRAQSSIGKWLREHLRDGRSYCRFPRLPALPAYMLIRDDILADAAEQGDDCHGEIIAALRKPLTQNDPVGGQRGYDRIREDEGNQDAGDRHFLDDHLKSSQGYDVQGSKGLHSAHVVPPVK
eukprot:1233380-Prymnesium_polylepis.1